MSAEWLLTKANPWELPAAYWVFGFFAIRGAIGVYDHLVIGIVEMLKLAKLPTRAEDAPPVRYVGLDATSIAYLIVNALQEWIFVQNLCYYIWHSPAVPKELAGVTLLNTIGALWFMFVVLDLCYAPMHRFLHWRPVYPYIHKHHHRQIFPVRGYLDAGNEHPVEHFIGTSCTWVAVYTAVLVLHAHASTIFLFFNVHAALAMLNHSEYDVDLTILGLNYSVKAHELHHRKFTTNYAQYWMGIDKFMGTFSPYEASTSSFVASRKTAPEKEKGG